MGGIKLEDDAPTVNGHVGKEDAPRASGVKDASGPSPLPSLSMEGAKSRSGSVETPDSQRPPRLSRKASQKRDLPQGEPLLFEHLPDVTVDSCKTFQAIPDCLYGSKHLGSTDNDALDCECREDWQDGENHACGEDSDCINRATKMECSVDDGNCGGGCQNQRFQRREYARVSVIKTEKKGFGLRADYSLHVNDFIYEYIGEVINEPTFRRRMMQYDDEGIKHFYFMSLNKSEFVDATKKGNLGRFCNHSCNPNCYVDKWVVGEKLRMGIFALRDIQAGEELVFNYNVDRYGAEPQPCYCGEANCVGFIGGKTQTERSTKLAPSMVEALGIDGGEVWEAAGAKKPRKKKPEEEDEEYVSRIQPRTLDEDDARKVMATLMQCKEKWIAVKLLQRIQDCDEEKVIHCVMRMHAYQILKNVLNTFIEDFNVVLQVLSILDKFPRMTRNKIQDSKIEASIEPLTHVDDENVTSKAKKLLDDWSKLEVAYRIRRRKFDPSLPNQNSNSFEDRRGGQVREEEAAQNKTASPQPLDAPRGPRNNQPQRQMPQGYFARPRHRSFQKQLPEGWFAARDNHGRTYFYDKQGTTTWERPTKPAVEPTVNKAAQELLAIQSIINKVTREGSTPKAPPTQQQPQVNAASAAELKREKIRSIPVEKQMKIYENTIHPHVKHVVDKFRHKLPKDELKRLGKDISKKLVSSDFKNGRVTDPSAELNEKQVQKIKKYVKDFLDKAVVKYNGHKERKAAQANKDGSKEPKESPEEEAAAIGDETMMSDMENGTTPSSPEKKRKRIDDESGDSPVITPPDGRDLKRLREEENDQMGTPPPPPPPPGARSIGGPSKETDEALREQEEALMRENEEAQRLEDEANKTKALEQAADDMHRTAAASRGTSEVLSH
ncbi:unnamed protein product [Clonostachys chloroleuca]|uniref:Histone-lysine N-methyltransferase, H3 lysine-36 specific n=1 Tax=Clonostachys chloroleuca TaxID=1926264 RepID=A0AA35M0D9_9HYPO|nr:unnamed protein product [Clonostachys chloroleuca]